MYNKKKYIYICVCVCVYVFIHGDSPGAPCWIQPTDLIENADSSGP